MIVGDELPRVVAAYQRMYGSSVEEVEALATTTSEAVLAAVGPLLEQ